MPTHTDTDTLDRPAHDAIAARIADVLANGRPGDDPHDVVAAGHAVDYLRGLFDALHAVDATRYTVRPSMLAGVRASGYDVIDTWLDESIEWCAGHAQATDLAAEQNRLNADDAAAELATTLDTFVGV